MEKSTTTFINTEKETRVFTWFMTLVLAGLTIFTIIEQPGLHSITKILPITLLVVVSIIAHWMIIFFLKRKNGILIYMLVQGALTVVLIFLTRNIGLTLGLAMALFGEAIGVYGLTGKGFFSSAYYLAISLGSYFWITKASNMTWWLISMAPIMIFVAMYVELYTRQSKANEKAQELLTELETTNQQLTEYAAQVEDLTIASERQRMARELHDTLSQGLAGLILQLEAVDANLAGGKTERGRQIIQQAMESARMTLSEARLAIDDLRQGQLTGCSEDLQKKISQFTDSTAIPCDFHCNLDECLTAAVADALVGVVTESLMNISRHANAKHVSINVDAQDNILALEIQDDGRGFDPSSVPAVGHYGLIGMHERVSLVNGTMEVISQPGAGTTIKVRIPCL
jgi:two-component system, NarL family, sensor histidine kinase YdfH